MILLIQARAFSYLQAKLSSCSCKVKKRCYHVSVSAGDVTNGSLCKRHNKKDIKYTFFILFFFGPWTSLKNQAKPNKLEHTPSVPNYKSFFTFTYYV
jgi:hypothetical protein